MQVALEVASMNTSRELLDSLSETELRKHIEKLEAERKASLVLLRAVRKQGQYRPKAEGQGVST